MSTYPICLSNTEFVSTDSLSIGIEDAGFLYGLGLFETMLVYNQKIPLLNHHLNRLQNSALKLGLALPTPLASLPDLLAQLCAKNEVNTARLTLYLSAGERDDSDLGFSFKNPRLFAVLRAHIHHSPPKPVSVILQKSNSGTSSLNQHKTMSYAHHILAEQQAFPDTPILVTQEDKVLESPTASVIFIKETTLYFPNTPYILSGVARNIIEDHALSWGFSVKKSPVSSSEIPYMDELFLCNALKGIIPVDQNKDYPNCISKEKTAILIKKWGKHFTK